MLWLWCRLAATAPIRPLAWEPPYVAGAALEKAKRQKKKKKKKKKEKKERKKEMEERKYAHSRPAKMLTDHFSSLLRLS